MKGSKTMNINFKKNEKTYIISVDYRHHTILSCYANNIVIYKLDLSGSLLKTIICDNCAIITVYKRSKKNKLNEQCALIINEDEEYITQAFASTNSKNLSFIDFVKYVQIFNNIKDKGVNNNEKINIF